MLRCYGRKLIDANDYPMASMKGFNTQVVPFSAQSYLDMAAKGAELLRTVIFWDLLEPSQGSVDVAGYITTRLDVHLQRLQAAGLYTTFALYFGPKGMHSPAWTGGTSTMSTYVTYGQNVTQYLANRYGNPVSPQYSPAVIGMGLNEVTPDSTTGAGWVSTLINQQVTTMAAWMRAYAPAWIAILCCGYGASAPYANAPGSGQSAQTFTSVPANPFGGAAGSGNFLVDMHDYFLASTVTTSTAAGFDGRNAQGLTRRTPYGPEIKIADATNSGGNNYATYPPVVCGTALSRATCRAQLAAFLAPYVAYCSPSHANVPLLIGESGWVPLDGITAFSGGDAQIADKLAGWATASPVGILQWGYSVTQSRDKWAARPGSSATGANAHGWQTWTETFFASQPTGVLSGADRPRTADPEPYG